MKMQLILRGNRFKHAVYVNKSLATSCGDLEMIN